MFFKKDQFKCAYLHLVLVGAVALSFSIFIIPDFYCLLMILLFASWTAFYETKSWIIHGFVSAVVVQLWPLLDKTMDNSVMAHLIVFMGAVVAWLIGGQIGHTLRARFVTL